MFLKILGVLFLIVILAALALAGWIFLKIRAFKKVLRILGECGRDAMGLPARIRVERTDDACRDQEMPRAEGEEGSSSAAPATLARPYVDQFLALGFEDLGTFLIREMPATRMAGFYHRELLLGGCVTMMDGFGVYAEVSAEFPSGAQFNVMNSSRSETATTRPNKRNIFVTTERVEDLVERAKQELAAQGEPPIDEADQGFAEGLEKQWATDMDARLAAWVDEEEVRRTVTADGQTPTEEDIQQTIAGLAEGYCRMATEACMDHFLKSNTMSAAEWQRCGQDVFLVHERQSDEDMLTAFRDNCPLPEESLTGPGSTGNQDRLEAFRQWALALTPPQFEQIGTVEFPVRAHVYAGNLQQTERRSSCCD